MMGGVGKVWLVCWNSIGTPEGGSRKNSNCLFRVAQKASMPPCSCHPLAMEAPCRWRCCSRPFVCVQIVPIAKGDL